MPLMSKGGTLSRLFPRFFKTDSKTKSGNAGRDIKGPSCSIVFLDDSEQVFTYKSNWKGQALFDQVCSMINLSEKVYFGLRFVDATGQTHWLDAAKSVSSQLKGCSAPHPKLYFGVKFYTADPCKLREEMTRYLFFLQVKRDILQGRLPVTFEEAAELCAYAVQSELGDFDQRIHTAGYVSEFCFVPNQTEELEARIGGMHRRCQGATPLMTEQKFLEKVKWLEMYGVDLHTVQDTSNVDYFLGLTPTGIVVYKHRTKIASHFWPRITKAGHKGKVFTIKVKDKNNDEHIYAFELSTKSACKHLWKCCVEHHTFFSERSERLATNESRSRDEPRVQRAPSKRKSRRVNSDSRLNTEQLYQDQFVSYNKGVVTLMGKSEPVKAPRHRSLPELHGRQSPKSSTSAPWESRLDHGLYTSGHDTPTSGRQTNYVSVGSDSESGISQRKRYFPSRKSSDNDSNASATRRRRWEFDSDSASEVSFPNSGQNRKNNFGHRNLKASDSNIAHPYRDKENNSHGSIPSVHSAPAGEVRQRRRRRRSKSPGNSKQPPEELKQHIEFDLIDTEGMTEDQLRDIAYTRVETKANLFRIKYSPKFRQKIWASRRKSFGSSGSNQKEGESTDLSRQDTNNTDPFQGYTQNNRQAGGLKGGKLADNKDSPHLQEMKPPESPSEQNKGYSSSGSRAYLNNQAHRSNKESPYDGNNSVRMRNDKMSRDFSDHEQGSMSRHQNRYEQNRLSYNEQNKRCPSEQVRQSPHEGNYRQNQSQISSHNPELERRKLNDQRLQQLHSEKDKYEADMDYNHSSFKQDSYNTSHSYGFNTGPRSSSHLGTAYNASVENSESQTPPLRYKETSVVGPQRVTSTLPRYSETSAVDPQRGASPRYSETSVVDPQRGASTSPRYSETSVVGSQRVTSTLPRYSETSAVDPQRGASPRYSETSFVDPQRGASTSPRYSETSAVDPQRGAFTSPRYSETSARNSSTPPRATTRMNFDQRPNSRRPGSHNYEDQEFQQFSNSGHSGPSSVYQGSPSGAGNFLSPHQNKMRYTNSSYHPQFGDKQPSQIPHNMGPPSERSPHSNMGPPSERSPHSNMNPELTSARQGYSRPSLPIKFRSDLVTQI